MFFPFQLAAVTAAGFTFRVYSFSHNLPVPHMNTIAPTDMGRVSAVYQCFSVTNNTTLTPRNKMFGIVSSILYVNHMSFPYKLCVHERLRRYPI